MVNASVARQMNHFTNKVGYDGIRAAPVWLFRADAPPMVDHDHPIGAYFSTLPPETPNLANRLRVSKDKTEYRFAFVDIGDLRPLRGGRGGNRATGHVFYSPVDYLVAQDRQRYHGPT